MCLSQAQRGLHSRRYTRCEVRLWKARQYRHALCCACVCSRSGYATSGVTAGVEITAADFCCPQDAARLLLPFCGLRMENIEGRSAVTLCEDIAVVRYWSVVAGAQSAGGEVEEEGE